MPGISTSRATDPAMLAILDSSFGMPGLQINLSIVSDI